jgi:putative ABC transport system ATP-binding protein
LKSAFSSATVRQFRLAPNVVQNVVTYNVVLDVDNVDELLKPGMTAQVRLVVANRPDVLRIPTTALRFRLSEEEQEAERKRNKDAKPGAVAAPPPPAPVKDPRRPVELPLHRSRLGRHQAGRPRRHPLAGHAGESMTGPLIDIRGVVKTYLSGAVETPVLHGVDLRVEHGDFVSVMGQSGSGKSTLMNILGCLDQATGGTYLLNGVDTRTLGRAELADIRNRTIGFVFQSFNLIKRMSVAENVALPLIYGGMGRAKAQARAVQELERVGLGEFAKRTPSQLSGGQQQRVAIARALVTDPPLLLADEPTGNLDTHTSDDIMTSFGTLNRERGITIVLVTHEPDVAAYSRRLVRLKDGRVLYDGPAAEGLQLASSQAGAAR